MRSRSSAFTWVLIRFSPHTYSLGGDCPAPKCAVAMGAHSVLSRHVSSFRNHYLLSHLLPTTLPRPYLPLLPKVRHDIVDVGFILGPPVLRPCRSLVCCVISFVLRVSLHLYPACDDLPICDRLQHPSAHCYDSCVFDMSRVPWRSGRSALVACVLRVIHHQRSYLVTRPQLQPIRCRIACSPR